MRKKRILWICNHVTLMDAEVPLLQELGFEVYVPKKYPALSDYISCKPGYDYDADLTIPNEDLLLLNSVDFYDDDFSPQVIETIQRNFDIAITTFYERPLRLLVNNFPGYIFIRAFGLAGDANYFDEVLRNWGQEFMDRMLAIRNRLYFTAAYSNMLKVEKNIFRENGIFLPLGLPENFGRRLKDGYIGSKRQIFFVCPRICSSPYYYNVYKKFKEDFRYFPYVIAGKSFGKINDRKLLGFLPREEFDRVFCESKMMYYHSTEPRHLHYHPLEAMFCNLPVVFHSQGMLGQLTPKVKYPGAADTIGEAKAKAARILLNDKYFIRDIQDSQKELLKLFDKENIKYFWEKNFMPLVSSPPIDNTLPTARKEHIGVILPLGYRGGTLHAFCNVIKMIVRCGYKVTAGIPEDYLEKGELYYPEIMDELRKKLPESVSCRFFKWQTLESDEVKRLTKMGRLLRKLDENQQYALMKDGVSNFYECDRWLFISDRFYKGVPLPLRPYSVMVYDYLQRYLQFQLLSEDLENTYISAVQQASAVFVTNEATKDDVVAYAGIERRKVKRMPFEFSSGELEKYLASCDKAEADKKDYIVWACNGGLHKNHLNILKALIRYYDEKDGKLDVYITGVGTEILNEKNIKRFKRIPRHIKEFHKLFEKHKKLLKKRVRFNGEMGRKQYFDLLRGARCLLLSSMIDNGAFGAVEAAYLGTPCACNDYPHMRFMAGEFDLDILWYKGTQVESITDALLSMSDCRIQLPPRERLEQMSYEKQQEKVSEILREAWI